MVCLKIHDGGGFSWNFLPPHPLPNEPIVDLMASPKVIKKYLGIIGYDVTCVSKRKLAGDAVHRDDEPQPEHLY